MCKVTKLVTILTTCSIPALVCLFFTLLIINEFSKGGLGFKVKGREGMISKIAMNNQYIKGTWTAGKVEVGTCDRGLAGVKENIVSNEFTNDRDRMSSD